MSSANDAPQSSVAAPQAAIPTAKPATAGRSGLLVALVFFGLLVAHVAINIDPQILYQADEALTPDRTLPTFPIYQKGLEFFKPALKLPGGMIEYAGASTSQYFSHPYGGVVILSAMALAAFVITGSIISQAGGKAWSLLRFIPPILLVITWNRYSFILANQLAMLVAILAVGLYLRLPDRARLRAVIALPMIVVLYYIAGGPCVLAALMCGLFELLARKSKIGWAYIVVGAITPLVVGSVITGLAKPHLRMVGFPSDPTALAAWMAFCAFYIYLAVSLGVQNRQEAGGAAPAPKLSPVVVRMALLLVIAAAVALLTLDRDVRTFRRICYASQRGQWVSVIREARELAINAPPEMYQGSTCRRLNRALYEKKLLGVKMFDRRYPQARWGSLLVSPVMDEPVKSDTLLQLGAIDLAEARARQSNQKWPDRPMTLRLLAKIAIVKKDWDAAKDYLQTLSKDLALGKFAEEMLARIDKGDDFSDDEEIAHIRSVMILGKRPGPILLQEILEDLTVRNPDNRMAFEYLMADYLLNRRLKPMVERVSQVTRFEYEEPYLPPHYAEAILLWALVDGHAPNYDGLPERDPGFLIASTMFERLFREHHDDLPALQAAVSRELPDTYFTYYFTSLLRETQAAEQPAGQ